MAVYHYKARNPEGRIVQSTAEGDDVTAVASALRRQGLLVIDVKARGPTDRNILDPFKRVRPDDLVVFTRQLATMINAGLPIVRSLYVLSEQTENERFLEVIGAVRGGVEAGLALSEALREHPKVFSRLYVEMVRAGEIGGMLDNRQLEV